MKWFRALWLAVRQRAARAIGGPVLILIVNVYQTPPRQGVSRLPRVRVTAEEAAAYGQFSLL